MNVISSAIENKTSNDTYMGNKQADTCEHIEDEKQKKDFKSRILDKRFPGHGKFRKGAGIFCKQESGNPGHLIL